MINDEKIIKGRGAQIITKNPFFKNFYVEEHPETIDELMVENSPTEYIEEFPKKIVNKINSPDLGFAYSLNPYQGCEHGCVYCYARNSHQYWGYSAGLDFERKIIVKKNAADLLEKHFKSVKWQAQTITVSGNTDCYQPIEKELKITRKILETCLKYKQAISIITKNQLILRDLDILQEMNKLDLVHINISITSLNEELRRNLEPRTATSKGRLKVIKTLSDHNIPVNVMLAPIIPALNSDEIPEILRKTAEMGASSAAFTMVRLNGSIAEIFENWIRKTYPDRADKVLNHIRSCHAGKLNDSRFGQRMRGDGKIADSIAQLFKLASKKYYGKRKMRPLNNTLFTVPGKQMKLF